MTDYDTAAVLLNMACNTILSHSLDRPVTFLQCSEGQGHGHNTFHYLHLVFLIVGRLLPSVANSLNSKETSGLFGSIISVKYYIYLSLCGLLIIVVDV